MQEPKIFVNGTVLILYTSLGKKWEDQHSFYQSVVLQKIFMSGVYVTCFRTILLQVQADLQIEITIISWLPMHELFLVTWAQEWFFFLPHYKASIGQEEEHTLVIEESWSWMPKKMDIFESVNVVGMSEGCWLVVFFLSPSKTKYRPLLFVLVYL